LRFGVAGVLWLWVVDKSGEYRRVGITISDETSSAKPQNTGFFLLLRRLGISRLIMCLTQKPAAGG
jgi:hypothetical protein